MSNVIETCIPLDHYITNLDACEQPDESKHAKEAEELVDASHAQRLEEAERVPVIWDRGCVYVDRTSVRRLWGENACHSAAHAPLCVAAGVGHDVDQVEGDGADQVDDKPGAEVLLWR